MGVVHNFIIATKPWILIFYSVKTMWASSNYLLYFITVQHFNICHCLHLEKKFISSPFCGIAGATFFSSQNGKIYICFIEQFHKGFGYFLCTVVKAPCATYPKQYFGFFALCHIFGHCWDFYRFTHFLKFSDLIFKYFNGNFFFNQISKSSFVACGSHQMVVHPVIITTSWFTHQHAVIFKTILF